MLIHEVYGRPSPDVLQAIDEPAESSAGQLWLPAVVGAAEHGPKQGALEEPIAPRRYQAAFPLQGPGRYRAVVSGSDGRGGEHRGFAGFAVPFSQ